MLEEECLQVPLPILLTGINDVFNESRQKVFNEDIVEIRKGMHEVLSFYPAAAAGLSKSSLNGPVHLFFDDSRLFKNLATESLVDGGG